MPFVPAVILLLSLFFSTLANAQPFTSFYQAKKHLSQQLSRSVKTLYCGCDITRQGKKLVPDPSKCGYQPRKPITRSGKPNSRATRIEWEHIVPAWEFGHQLQCWQSGGRAHCRKVSAQFRRMEADIRNLAPAIGEINGDRSNYRFGMLPNTPYKHGACAVKIDFKQRVIEPPVYARKQIAEAYFYMQKTYGLKIAEKQQKLFQVWANLNQ
ncbi:MULTISPECIES: endonuclease [Pseudoalteromonas]|uniref:Endonuclease n=1 Tax=Pseudoalteromonas obscura TaxID=3048491 RepID=A0ABT7ET10_9GAMM|nr:MULTISPECIES: endonuclease [Pseudoalteromonas]MBQ4839259.1 endonuclease [Pseudoalteromonas luteoviolacea]MDK2598100.1 endonuclease [Pseudoalteromonas sp. P94(2023)]